MENIYAIDEGPEIVRLNISNATRENNGTWKCTLTTKFSNATDGSAIVELNVLLIVIRKLFPVVLFYYHGCLIHRVS